MLACGLCPTCLAGNALSCQHSRFLGVHQHGAFAEYIAVPAMAVYPLPDGVTFTQGAYTEPVAASLAVLKAGIEAHEKGLIYGDNRIAHLTKQILDVYGFADVTVCDATTAVLPADTYVSVVRTSWTSQALRLTTRGGQDIVDPWLRRALTPLGSQDLWASNGSMRRSFNIKECTRFQKIARWKQAAPIIFLIEHGQDRG
jgi:D-arabinose 1-dehydrogenase-like Zn-dependent alcohol dehydrogenase